MAVFWVAGPCSLYEVYNLSAVFTPSIIRAKITNVSEIFKASIIRDITTALMR
jgi:hypothetical protein